MPGWSRKGWLVEALPWEAKALDGLELPGRQSLIHGSSVVFRE
jgi:hypothetical protein